MGEWSLFQLTNLMMTWFNLFWNLFFQMEILLSLDLKEKREIWGWQDQEDQEDFQVWNTHCAYSISVCLCASLSLSWSTFLLCLSVCASFFSPSEPFSSLTDQSQVRVCRGIKVSRVTVDPLDPQGRLWVLEAKSHPSLVPRVTKENKGKESKDQR